jgi:cysteine desulfuration protein SufE
MYESCLEKQAQIKKMFEFCQTEESKYGKIIELGRTLPPIDAAYKIPDNRVKGCQSTMYLHSKYQEGHVYFVAESDALISSGLAFLLVFVYSGQTPEAILKCPPTFLEELGITASLTPNRANGLYSLHLRMKQDTLKYLVGR